jgi:hypothetical protein
VGLAEVSGDHYFYAVQMPMVLLGWRLYMPHLVVHLSELECAKVIEKLRFNPSSLATKSA